MLDCSLGLDAGLCTDGAGPSGGSTGGILGGNVITPDVALPVNVGGNHVTLLGDHSTDCSAEAGTPVNPTTPTTPATPVDPEVPVSGDNGGADGPDRGTDEGPADDGAASGAGDGGTNEGGTNEGGTAGTLVGTGTGTGTGTDTAPGTIAVVSTDGSDLCAVNPGSIVFPDGRYPCYINFVQTYGVHPTPEEGLYGPPQVAQLPVGGADTGVPAVGRNDTWNIGTVPGEGLLGIGVLAAGAMLGLQARHRTAATTGCNP
ncbi:hypothetical protein [Arthrobacter sp. B0490]|uniref:hypothetical protein n=1 Tax=Arthrobacter sp. B0490 TaxID=2058891 RepID=UPI000CE3B79C|nr:hypothetical protein [Arthrobacter sp. B0490]